MRELLFHKIRADFSGELQATSPKLGRWPISLEALVRVVAIGILGYRSGLEGGRSLVAEATLALVLAAIVVIIIDLDHPYQGLIVISQDFINQLRQTMGP